MGQLVIAFGGFCSQLQVVSSVEEFLAVDLVPTLGVCVTGFFALMVLSLLLMQGYLAFENLTTWEVLRWMKISYMKVWPKRYGSPFSVGTRANLRLYCFINCRYRTTEFKRWKIPISLPSLGAIKPSRCKRFWSLCLDC